MRAKQGQGPGYCGGQSGHSQGGRAGRPKQGVQSQCAKSADQQGMVQAGGGRSPNANGIPFGAEPQLVLNGFLLTTTVRA